MFEIVLAIIIASILYIPYSKYKASKAGPKMGELRIIKRGDIYFPQVFGPYGWRCISSDGSTWDYENATTIHRCKFESEKSAGEALNRYARLHQGETTVVWSQATTTA